MLRVLPPTQKTLQPYLLQDTFVMGAKTRNIAIQLVLQPHCKTCTCSTCSVARFTVA